MTPPSSTTERPHLLALLLLCALTAAPAWAQEEEPAPEVEASGSAGLFHRGLNALPLLEPPAGVPSLSSNTCGGCHQEIHDQWADSGHGQAFTSPVFQAAWAVVEQSPMCLHCHAPLAAQQPFEVTGYRNEDPLRPRTEVNADFDPALQAQGVGCAACHVRDGAVVGSRPVQEGVAPHPVVVREELGESAFCASCHDLAYGTEDDPHRYYQTFHEWAASPQARFDISCQDCHMGLESGRVAGNRFAAFAGHAMTGSRDPLTLQRAVTTELKLSTTTPQRGENLRVDIALLNTGAGHAVPTGSPANELELSVRLVPLEGTEVGDDFDGGAEVWRLRRELAAEPPHAEQEDTRLLPGERRELRWSYNVGGRHPAGQFMLEIDLLHLSAARDQATAAGLDPADWSTELGRWRTPIEVR